LIQNEKNTIRTALLTALEDETDDVDVPPPALTAEVDETKLVVLVTDDSQPTLVPDMDDNRELLAVMFLSHRDEVDGFLATS